MAARIRRDFAFVVNGDGTATQLVIDLRQQLESSPSVGAFAPSSVDYASISAKGTSPAPPSISSTSLSGFVLTINFSAALPNGSGNGNGYNLLFALLFSGQA